MFRFRTLLWLCFSTINNKCTVMKTCKPMLYIKYPMHDLETKHKIRDVILLTNISGIGFLPSIPINSVKTKNIGTKKERDTFYHINQT